MMRTASVASIGALVIGTVAQTSTFEPADFNITKALIDNVVDVSAIPELSGLVGIQI